MGDETPVEMGRGERDEFLSTGGTGVLSLSTTGEGPPHAVPVSYGYDAADETFYFRLAVGSDSDKGDLDDRAVTFVVYGADGAHGTDSDAADGVDTDDRWHSVVARGRLERTDESGIAAETLAGLERVDIPLVDIFDEPLRTVDFAFFRLRPDELSAREEVRRSSSG